MRTYYAVKDVEDVLGNVLSVVDERRVSGKGVILTSY